ncbi:MAG: M23 family metallopeptidase [Calditrichia bacterium]|nr:M23 family metallopeptidase [Calditrichota bacterium]MCB0267023.1 M23 family metallopeptidase [Calditrichota bacterium]MCB0285285.1 M23 family metallopeptidase [Calditrichota bacterium]MCB9068661.1 M23 family metallopeptidase [Calditrichia bacterium]
MRKKPLLIYVNPESSGVKEFKLSFKKIALATIAIVVGVGMILKFSIDHFIDYSENSKISQLKIQNETLHEEIEKIGQKLLSLNSSLDFLEERDDQLRTLLDLPPIDSDVRKVGVGGTDPNITTAAMAEAFSFSTRLAENLKLLDKLDREVRLEKESYEKLIATVERQQDSLRYLPVLKPVPNAYISSSFGNRRHPIKKYMHFHKGVDMAAPGGTPIIAPADGVVSSSGRNGGYGLEVMIDHKYGFKTRFGHMQKIYVRKGQHIKRGDKIGEVGKTGLTTSYHLHYEVYFKGKPLNPENFYFDE